MMQCPACNSEITDESRFCSSCGESVDSVSMAKTIASSPSTNREADASNGASRGISDSVSSSSFSASGIHGRFAPGQLLAERYRIVALIGRGGMGEVYRADDLKLEQPVALKFLPENLAGHPERLSRFRGEVRIARQVSHRNVCRVYDIGEVAGQHYLSMEYVDGEDLASLLKRIGRIPLDKGVEIARQLCAGLAAAHDKGIIHRDLKPANIMIDGEGKVRVMDFGLAALVADSDDTKVFAGTPAYMAPEQLAGGEATAKSDIYALGLILYELFTGHKAHTGGTIAEISQQRAETIPASPSTIIHEIDPAVERIILHCLEADEKLRPPSALAVAGALPGGDPLAAALAAGETPSPEMVAAAGKMGAIKPITGWLLLVGVLLCTVLGFLASGEVMLHRKIAFDKPPVLLEERAKQIIANLGYTDPVKDRVTGHSVNWEYLRYAAENDSMPNRWDDLPDRRPPAVYFWYRESPRDLLSWQPEGRVSQGNPPNNVSGMKRVVLDLEGRLIAFDAVPPQAIEVSSGTVPADWKRLFESAELDPELFTPTDSVWNPPFYCDALVGWTGTYPDDPETSIRVEAASYRGKPVYFRVLGPWNRPTRMQPYERSTGSRAAEIITVVLVLAALGGSALIVRRNLKLGLGDRRGATRIALFIFAVGMVSWALGADHVRSPGGELDLFIEGVSGVLFSTVFIWLLYVALEPIARRRWPERMVAWTRLLTGRLRDPLVGRDTLIGILCGAICLAVVRGGALLPILTGTLPPMPNPSGTGAIGGFGRVIGVLLSLPANATLNALFFLFFPLMILIVFRKLWVAVGVFYLIVVALTASQTGYTLLGIVASALLMGIWVFVTMRLGLLASAACFFTFMVLQSMPVPTDTSAWYFASSILGPALIAAMAVFGFRTALGR